MVLSAAVGMAAIIVIVSPESILPVNFYAMYPISGITGVLGGVIAWMRIKKRQENISHAARVAIVFSGSIISLIGMGLLVFVILIYAAD